LPWASMGAAPPPPPPKPSTSCFDLYNGNSSSNSGFISSLFDPQKMLLRRLFFLDWPDKIRIGGHLPWQGLRCSSGIRGQQAIPNPFNRAPCSNHRDCLFFSLSFIATPHESTGTCRTTSGTYFLINPWGPKQPTPIIFPGL
jgi:hypothetical protein